MFVKLQDVKGNRVYVDPYSVTHVMEYKALSLSYEGGSVTSVPYTEIGLRSGKMIYVKEDCTVVQELIAQELE